MGETNIARAREGAAMKGLKDTLVSLTHLRQRFERLIASAAKRGRPVPAVSGRLDEVVGFGSNPGNLRMFTHVPRQVSAAPALVVALHGCTQTANVYDHGSGWSALADDQGFVVMFPEQQRANNPNTCFNWFLPSDTQRGRGEALSIYQMVERAIVDHGIDPGRVFIVGLSAGGAMASAMLAAYPEVFAGGAIVAGLPYGCAANVQEAFEAMARGRDQDAQTWGNLVRSASPHHGPWPKLSIWHGTSDTIVNPKNMEDSLRQWLDVHGLSARPRVEHELEGHSRRVWRNEDDEDVIEAIAIRGMDHGVPLATGQGPERCGNAGPFHIDVGLSSGHHIVRFLGIAGQPAAFEDRASVAPLVPIALPQELPSLAARQSARQDMSSGRAEHMRHAEDRDAGTGAYDPRPVIAAALKAAGLLGDHKTTGATPDALDPREVITATLRSVGLLKD
jgi:poly(hydroxyalkanoate) depolymerase family esterase